MMIVMMNNKKYQKIKKNKMTNLIIMTKIMKNIKQKNYKK